jgi:hypothetical protein
LIYENFPQGNNAQIRIWSSLLHRSDQEDSKKNLVCIFSKIYTIYYEFLNLNKFSNLKLEKTNSEKKGKGDEQCWANFWPKAPRCWPGLAAWLCRSGL